MQRRPAARLRGGRLRGQALSELAIILPVILILLLGALDLGRVFYAKITITNAAKEGALVAARGGSFVSNAACSATNTVMCGVLNEAKGGFVEVDKARVSQSPTTSPACPRDAASGSTVSVAVDAPFRLLTPIIAAIFGGEGVTVSATAVAECAVVPQGLAEAEPSASATASAAASATAPSCLPPVAVFGWSQDAATNKKVNFSDMSSDMSAECNPIWYWTFGDGATSSERSPSHTYGNASAKTVTLRVTNSAGTDATWQTVTP